MLLVDHDRLICTLQTNYVKHHALTVRNFKLKDFGCLNNKQTISIHIQTLEHGKEVNNWERSSWDLRMEKKSNLRKLEWLLVCGFKKIGSPTKQVVGYPSTNKEGLTSTCMAVRNLTELYSIGGYYTSSNDIENHKLSLTNHSRIANGWINGLLCTLPFYMIWPTTTQH